MNISIQGHIHAAGVSIIHQWGEAIWNTAIWHEEVNDEIVYEYPPIILLRGKLISGGSTVTAVIFGLFADSLLGSCVASSAPRAISESKWDTAVWDSGVWRGPVFNLTRARSMSSLVENYVDVAGKLMPLVYLSNSFSSSAKWDTAIWDAYKWAEIGDSLLHAFLRLAVGVPGHVYGISSSSSYLGRNREISTNIITVSNSIGNVAYHVGLASTAFGILIINSNLELPAILMGKLFGISAVQCNKLHGILSLRANIKHILKVKIHTLTTQTTEEYRLVPLSKYVFDNAVLSLQMNSEMSNIYRWLDGLTHGTDVVYGGRYKLKFNKTLNTLDIVYNKQMFVYNGNSDREYNTTEDTVVARIFSNGNVSIKGTLTQSASL